MSFNSFSPLNLYYLEQLGITPWVVKNASYGHTKLSRKILKLLLVTSTSLSNNTQLFLDRILNYIQFNEDYVLYIREKNESLDEILEQNLHQDSSIVLLTFGVEKEQLKNSKILHSIVEHNPLEQVLRNSSLKKRLFLELSQLKNLMN